MPHRSNSTSTIIDGIEPSHLWWTCRVMLPSPAKCSSALIAVETFLKPILLEVLRWSTSVGNSVHQTFPLCSSLNYCQTFWGEDLAVRHLSWVSPATNNTFVRPYTRQSTSQYMRIFCEWLITPLTTTALILTRSNHLFFSIPCTSIP